MLNRDKVAQEIQNLAAKLFSQNACHEKLSQAAWREIVESQVFAFRVAAAKKTHLLADWQDSLADTFKVESELQNYTVLAVDGSQIYPDRHIAGASCFLINAGGCLISYGITSKATLFSEPTVYLPEQIVGANDHIPFSIDLVDLKREACEFDVALKKSREYLECNNAAAPFICLFDGSLIFWHLESKPEEVRELFFATYIDYMNQFYKNSIVIAGYVSLPKSKELVHLLNVGLCGFAKTDIMPSDERFESFPCAVIDELIDTHLARSFLEPGYRSTVLLSNAKIVEQYPAHLKPCFFYLDVGKEIVRVEIPAWVAKDPDKLSFVAQACLNQALKGSGYPVVLAEAHEQAVVKGPDRDFFYHLICKIGIQRQQRVFMSQKSLKKRGISI